MSDFARELADRVESYIALRRSLGFAFQKQASVLRALARYVEAAQLEGPLTRDMALGFIFSREGTANSRATRHGLLGRFCEHLAIYDPRTEPLDPHALPRSRAIPPPRILSDVELESLISACRRVSPRYPERGITLTMLVGLLASTGLRSGEALRLDRGRRRPRRRRSAHQEDEVPQGSSGSRSSYNAGGATPVCAASPCSISGAKGFGILPQLARQQIVVGGPPGGVQRRPQACRSRRRQGLETASPAAPFCRHASSRLASRAGRRASAIALAGDLSWPRSLQ